MSKVKMHLLPLCCVVLALFALFAVGLGHHVFTVTVPEQLAERNRQINTCTSRNMEVYRMRTRYGNPDFCIDDEGRVYLSTEMK
jgi:hypothetical protein